MKDTIPEKILKAKTYSKDILNYCHSISQTKLTNRDKLNPHGEKIVEIYTKANDIENFIRMWRQHFLDNNETKYLPQGWSVEHKMERQFGEHSIFRN